MEQNTCAGLIKQINDAMEKNANNAMRAHDLTMTQCATLLWLKGAGETPVSLKELERLLHVAQSTAAGIVSRLEQKGLVEGCGSAEDRRIKLVRLTAAGRERCRAAEQDMAQAEEQLLSGLTAAERSQFQGLLQKVRRTL